MMRNQYQVTIYYFIMIHFSKSSQLNDLSGVWEHVRGVPDLHALMHIVARLLINIIYNKGSDYDIDYCNPELYAIG